MSPPKYAAIRKIALGFPGAREVEWHGDPWFVVGKKSFALFGAGHDKWILKLPQAQQMMLFDARPDTFTPMRAGRMVWSFIDVARLDAAELKDLLTAAWKMVVTKKAAKAYESA
ncbi:MAG TPA: MmcQ/YjbR family DNA-binding protein [Rhizomicrobium sp.]|jgi:hypothetical protein|nr:MmcQ/YjbR family DNA-binding protein [Rhizomicrobium sp.]